MSVRRHALPRVQLLALVLGIFWLDLPLAAALPNDELFAEVVRRAQAAAARPCQPNDIALPPVLQHLNYDTYRDITFRQQRSLWHDSDVPFRVQFFHPGYLFRHPVAINVVDGEQVRAVPFSAKYFRYPDFDPARMGDQSALGFAGLRLLYHLNQPGRWDEVISFLGSNYFRALGAGQIYGISARGIAIDTAENLTEEFPIFREFWLCQPEPGVSTMELFALLDGPSVSGAYRFVITPGADTKIEVASHLCFRRPVQVLGLAPLTSMFWRDQSNPRPPNDKRPEVHDSDGLLLTTAAGEEQWHALAAVPKITTQLFPMTNPKSFALLQRDRDPSHYRDREAKYERRPSVLVESLGEWGKGNVRLMQLPAANEYNDNVIAFWQPEKSPAAGDELEFKYRLHWFANDSNKP
jgi:periplasmic glucans biosynthesis protein